MRICDNHKGRLQISSRKKNYFFETLSPLVTNFPKEESVNDPISLSAWDLQLIVGFFDDTSICSLQRRIMSFISSSFDSITDKQKFSLG